MKLKETKHDLLITSQNHGIQIVASFSATTADPFSHKDIQSIAKRILSQECIHSSSLASSLTSKSIKQIKISIDSSRTDISYTINNQAASRKLETADLSNPIPDDLTIRVMTASTKALATRFNTIQEIRARLLEDYPVRLPIIHFIWDFITYPLSTILFLFKPRVYDTTDLVKAGLAYDEESLLSAIKWSRDAFKMDSKDDPNAHFGQKYSIDAQFKEALTSAKEWKRSTKRPQLAAGYAQEILSRFKELSAKEETKGRSTNLMLLPTGHWKNPTTFQPVLWAFYINDQQKLCLAEMKYTKEGSSLVRDYVWNNDLTAETLGRYMESMLWLSVKDEARIPSKWGFFRTKAGEGMIDEQRRLELDKKRKDPDYKKQYAEEEKERELQPYHEGSGREVARPLFPINPEEFRQRGILSTGAEVVDRGGERRVEVRESPWKIIHETARLQFPEAPFSDKLTFTYKLLSDRLEKILKALPQMKGEERSRWLHELKLEKESFERQLKKVTLSDKTMALFTDQEGPFAGFAAKLKLLEVEIENLDKARAATQKKRAAGLGHYKQGKCAIQLPGGLQKDLSYQLKNRRKLDELQRNKQLSTLEDLQKVSTIKCGFNRPDEVGVERTLQALQELQKKLDQFNDKGAYGTTIELYHQVISQIPTPDVLVGEGMSPYWKALKEKVEETKSTEILDKTSHTLSQMTKMYWEAKMKMKFYTIEGDERVKLLTLHAAHINMMKLRKEWGAGKSRADGISIDDYIIQEINLSEYADELLWSMEGLMLTKNLLPTANPRNEQVLWKLRSFINSLYSNDADKDSTPFSFDNRKTNIGQSQLNRDSIDVETLKRINKRWGDYYRKPVPVYPDLDLYKSGLKNGYEFYKSVISSRYSEVVNPSENAPAMPRHDCDIMRHNLLINSLFFNDTEKEQLKREIEQLHRLELKDFDEPSFSFFIGDRRNKARSFYDELKGTKVEPGILCRPGFSLKNEKNLLAMLLNNWKYGGYSVNREYSSLQNHLTTTVATKNQSEDGLLNKRMNESGDGNPFDKWTKDLEQFAGENTLYSSKQLEEDLDLAIQRFDLFDHPENQERLFFACNRPDVIQMLLRENPDYLIRRSGELRQAIEGALRKGKRNRALFLAMLTGSVSYHAKYALEKGDEPYLNLKLDHDKLQQIATAMPTLLDAGALNADGTKVSTNLLDLLFNLIQGEQVPLEDKVQYASYIVGFFAKDPRAVTPEKIEAIERDPTIIAGILSSLNILEACGHMSAVQELSTSGLNWGNEELLPMLLQRKLPATIESFSKVLDKWLLIEDGLTVPHGDWLQKDPSMPVYTKNGVTIDLLARTIKYEGRKEKKYLVDLPSSVTRHHYYHAVFGEKKYKATVVKGIHPKELIFTFVDDQGKNTNIIHTSGSYDIIIEQQHPARKQGEKAEWYRYTEMKAIQQPTTIQDNIKHEINQLMMLWNAPYGIFKKVRSLLRPEGIENQFLQRGVWVNTERTREGLIYLNPPSEAATKSHALYLTFDNHDIIPKINQMLDRGVLLESASTENGDRVVLERGDRLDKIFSPTQKSNILFISSRKNSSISEIRLIEQGLVLKRQSEMSPWVVDSKEYHGYQWVLGGGEEAARTNFLTPLGVNVEEFGLTLKDPHSGEMKLLMWPHALQSEILHKHDPLKRLEFIKEKNVGSPIVMTLHPDTTVQGPSEGYYYLAYLFAAKHDYEMAQYYLGLAANGRLKTVGDLDILKKLRSEMKKIAGSSMRLNAIKLKAELIALKIARQQSEPKSKSAIGFMQGGLEESSESYIKKLLLEMARHSVRGPLRLNSGKALVEFLEKDQKELTLDLEEKLLIEKIIGESLPNPETDFNDQATGKNTLTSPPLHPRLSPLMPYDKVLWAWIGASPDKESLKKLAVALISNREKPYRNPYHILKTLSQHPADIVVTQFFSFWNTIVEKKLTPLDLIELMGPLPLLPEESNSRDENGLVENPLKTPALTKELTLNHRARKLLVALAANNLQSKEPCGMIDMKMIRKTQGMIPSTTAENVCNSAVRGAKGLFYKLVLKKKDDSYEALLNKMVKNLDSVAGSFSSLYNHSENVVEVEKGAITVQPTSEDQLVTPLALDPLAEKRRNPNFKTYQHQILPQIETLEASFSAAKPQRSWPQADKCKLDQSHGISFSLDQDKYLCTPTHSSLLMTPEKLQQANKTLGEMFSKPTADTIEQHENELLKKGCEKLSEELIARLKAQSHVVDAAKLESLHHDIKSHTEMVRGECRRLRERILKETKELAPHQVPTSLKWVVSNGEKVGDSALIDALLNSYQRMERNLPETIEQNILNFLILSTEAGMLEEHAARCLGMLETLKGQTGKLNTDEAKNGWEKEWNLASFELLKVISTSTNRSRYLDKDGSLVEPRFSRKFLVAEYRNNIILSSDQVRIVKEMTQNPVNWYELRMGLGKTSYIFPLVLMLLAEEGFLPCGLVKRELLNQNLDSLDRTTRSLIEQAAITFSCDINKDSTYETIAEEYLRLLKAKEEKGYILTTVESVASLDHTQILLLEALKKILQSTNNQNDDPDLFTDLEKFRTHCKTLSSQQLYEVTQIETKLYWVGKIRQLIKGKMTRIIGDEIDEIFDSLKENNLAIGTPVALNQLVCRAVKICNEVIDQSNDPNIQKLKKALRSKEQAALRAKEVREKMMPALIREYWQHPSLRAALEMENDDPDSKVLDNVDVDRFVSYICGTGTNPIDLSTLSEEGKKKVVAFVGSLKRINTSLTICLQQDPEIDIGVKKSDGYTVGPQINGEEIPGMLYGDEYDVIVNHIMTYAFSLPESSFIRNAILEFQERFPTEFAPFYEQAKAEGFIDLFAYFKEPKNWEARLALLQNRVFLERLVKRYKEQHLLNVQEAVHDTFVGGMTGTLYPYLLPTRKDVNDSASVNTSSHFIPRSVESETLLRIACMENPKVTAVANSEILNKMATYLSNPECKAIINEGSSFQGMNAFAAVKALRDKDTSSRTFIYVDPKSRKPMLWRPGTLTRPFGVDSKELAAMLVKDPALRSSCLFYFGPSDTRGTDFKIPPGLGVVISGPTTTVTNWMQADWRLRGLGEQHSCEFIIPAAVQDRIVEEQGVDGTLIDWTHLFEDIKTQSLSSQKGINLKSTKLKITSILKKGLRDLQGEMCGTIGPITFEKIFMDLVLSSTIRKLNLLIVQKAINFELDFADSSLIEIEEYLKGCFDIEMKKLEALKDELRGYMEVDSSDVKDYFQQVDTRIAEIKKALDNLNKEMFSAIEEHKKNLPNKVPSNGGGEAASLEQVQELQLQQQQQQEMVVIKRRRHYHFDRDFKKWDCDKAIKVKMIENPAVKQGDGDDDLFNMLSKKAVKVANVNPEETKFSNYCGFSPNLFMSNYVSSMYMNWRDSGQLKGDPIGLVAVVGKAAIILSHSDYHYSFKEYLRKKREEKDETPIGVYKMLNGEVDIDRGVLLDDEALNTPDLLADQSLRIKIVQAKWLMGYYQYTDAEKEDLKVWLKSLQDKEAVENELYGDEPNENPLPDVLENLRKWTAENSVANQLKLFDQLVLELSLLGSQ